MTPRLKVVLTPRALSDLIGIRDYLLDRSPVGAENVRRLISATIERLGSYPSLGRDRPELGVRSIGVPKYGYTIYYRAKVDAIEIIHVRDDRRQPLDAGDL
jgi:toxin ParE1/3/4